MNLRPAIIQFLANEFKFDANNLNPDTSFAQDLGLSPAELSDLLQRMQDALNFILPEDSQTEITTVGQLIALVNPEES